MDPVQPPPDHSWGDRLVAIRHDGDPLDRQAVLAQVQQGLFSDAEDPLQLGRFEVTSRLGAGASGVVYAAYDPKLERKIALKLLRPDGDLGDGARQRLIREAQALARLSHPHVVSVHDVGDVDDRVFIAMELLEGGTLRQWVDAERRSVESVVAAYIDAGTGLAAAHAAGLVHRDFKPDNVLLDDRGRARVVDFGLAREQIDPGMSVTEAVITAELPHTEVVTRLTQTGAMLGTPAYMAPEQMAGRPADARTDQYSFCVSLYEALYGERPFEGDTLPALALAAQKGVVRPASPGRSVPAWIRRAILIGLKPDPAARHRNMNALLACLRRDPYARLRKWGLGGLVLFGAVAATWSAATERSAAAVAPCSGVEQHLAGVWDDTRRGEVKAGLLGTGHPRAEEIWTTVSGRLDHFADTWVQARRDVCEAREGRDESEQLTDRRTWCLERARLTLSAATARFTEADRQTANRALEIVPADAYVDDCGARSVLDDGEPPPTAPEERKRLQAVEAEIAELASLRLAGHYSDLLHRSLAQVEEAEALGHAPTLASALFELGAVYGVLGQRPESIEALSRAANEAERGRADRTRAEVNAVMIKRLSDIGNFAEARRLLHNTEALFQRLTRPPVGSEARIAMLWAHVEWMEGNYARAIEYYDDAIASSDGNTDPIVVALHSEAWGHRGAAALDAGRLDEAIEGIRNALSLRRAIVGDNHPELAPIHANLGAALLKKRDLEGGELQLRKAFAIRELHLGDDHELLAANLSNLGAVVMRKGDVDEALRLFQRSFELMESSLGPNSAELAAPLHNMALAHVRKREFDQAQQRVQQAIDLRFRVLGPEHPRSLDSLYQLGYVQQKAKDYDAARATYERHLKLLQEHRPDAPVPQIYARIGLADIALNQGRPQDAQRLMERARQDLRGGPELAPLRTAVVFNLAKAIEDRGGSHRRATELAVEALGYADDDGQKDTIKKWLTERSAK
ncbi:MAG: tetratricopeptide repeat protein [Myxococcota bacterium]